MAPTPRSPAVDFLFPEKSAKDDDPLSSLFVASNELDIFTKRDAMSPIAQHDIHRTLERRADSTAPKGQGTTAPNSINNQGFFALFAILGAGMVVAAIWFFFWAKNGGFQFQEGDWDDYKSTVLRRKGPDGKTLSNATKSTKLGGGTIRGSQHYNWAKQQARSVISRDEKGRKGILAKRGWGNSHSVTYSDDFTDTLGTRTVTDGMTEIGRDDTTYYGGGGGGHHSKRYRDRDVNAYKKEKPARVGGMNRVADSAYTDTDRSDVMTETVLTESSEQPMIPKTDKEKEKQRAERKARHEAARMERRWKREAEEAAAALAAESRPPPPPIHVRKSGTPSKNAPSSRHHRERSASRSASPRKRDFSYGTGPESETLSTAYTQSTSDGTRSASYYNEYRPRASENPRYTSEYGNTNRSSRQSSSSPRKKDRRTGGYRRGGQDGDLE